MINIDLMTCYNLKGLEVFNYTIYQLQYPSILMWQSIECSSSRTFHSSWSPFYKCKWSTKHIFMDFFMFRTYHSFNWCTSTCILLDIAIEENTLPEFPSHFYWQQKQMRNFSWNINIIILFRWIRRLWEIVLHLLILFLRRLCAFNKNGMIWIF